MERIKNILQRLQELYYSKHQKSAVDVDLMMDYTRVMYADLLEWRGQFKEPITTETAEKNTDVITSEAAHEEAKEQEPVTEDPATSEEKEIADETKEEKEEANQEAGPEQNKGVTDEVKPEEVKPVGKDEPMQPAVAYKPIERDEPPAREPVEEDETPVVEVHPEQEQVNTLMADATGISFEPPAQKEVINEVKEELEIEAPNVNQPVEEIAAPAPVEIPLPDMMPPRQPEKPSPQAQLFQAAKTANKDIRGSIGINDKYLFLNELFNNHKSNYEETLDKLNHFSTLAQAEDWIITKVAPAQKWDKNDATVQSFYAMLAKHFSDR